ncbi:divergent polysaccharide deacetylase family protein [Halopseudomonas nanhaiensis]|uniref:divergent polysaccharide deacetylase family protein n=1 Tax=Halopseudomonas nanhaiensis TaxID=2830842 RepID=UPI001CC0570A|nr:divergent polysaccharide deacetylase family protein [Halopseudomonas nanhaiensis]UAW98615.1 divergent polysaccharide deacetylase family protein [Halopseudomonas nanhaiensis]
MRRCGLLLLALWLAGCDTSQAPSQHERDSPEAAPSSRREAAEPERDRVRSEWMVIEHAGWRRESAVTVPPEAPAVAAQASPVAGPPALAIIIDDVGHGYAVGHRLITLPFPLALAILPFTPSGQRLATEAAEAGHTVMLHLPMENLAGSSPGPGGLHAAMSPTEFRQTLDAALDNLPAVRGVNNHMGSLLTTLRPQMDWVMQELAERGLFFVDSRTQAATQAAFAAQARGLPNLSRDVFLDNVRTPQAMEAALQVALEKARQQGYAVIIAHPYPETLMFLESRIAQVPQRDGVQLVPLESLLGRPPALPHADNRR